MRKICATTGKTFKISQKEQEYCGANQIPLPTLHPYERLRNLFLFRNRLGLYTDRCALTGASMLSAIPPEKKLTVYDLKAWESDDWDPMDYGMEYDFNKPFFAQFHELMRKVPWPSRSALLDTMENSDYTNGITGAKNCYLVFSASWNEDCMYSRSINGCKDTLDCVQITDSQLCYDCSYAQSCYNLKYSAQCFNCTDSAFLYSCQGLKNCFGCVNLANKEYHYYNKPLSREEYEAKMEEIDLGSHASLQKEKEKFHEFRKKFPVKYMIGKNNENSSGNFLSNTKNCKNSFFCTNVEDAEYSIFLNNAKNSFFHACYGNKTELIYNCHAAGDDSYNIKFSSETWKSAHDLEYCMFCSYGSGNCFGCFGLKRKNYCILNKQYKKEEYFDLLARIKKHMLKTSATAGQAGEYGQFFPTDFSPFYYNHSDANAYFPLTKEQALGRGFSWLDEPAAPFESDYKIPDNIDDVRDDVLSATLKCETTGKKYKIIRQELDYYRKHRIPLPRTAPLERISQRSDIFHIQELRDEKCARCSAKIQTVYDSEENAIYCEKCYLQEVY